MTLVTAKVALTLNAAGAEWSSKNVNIPNAKAKAALGDEWLLVEQAAKMLGFSLDDGDYTFSNYSSKSGERQLSSPKVAMYEDTPSLVWGSQALALSVLKANKGIEIGFETKKSGVVFNVTEVLAIDSEAEPLSIDFPVVADKEGLGEDPVKVLKTALRTGKWVYKAEDGQEKPLIKTIGTFAKMGEYEGQTVIVVGLDPKDSFGKNNLRVIDPKTGSIVSLSGNTGTQNAVEQYLSVVEVPFTKDEPGTLVVGEARTVASTGKTTYRTTLVCPRASKAVPMFVM